MSILTNPSSADPGCSPLQELEYAEDSQVDHGAYQHTEAIPPQHAPLVNESGTVLPSLDPPQPRQPSWVSENSDTSSAVISTAARLTRANAGISMISVAARRTAVIFDDDVRVRQPSMVASEYPFDSRLSAVYPERPGDKGQSLSFADRLSVLL
jgi:hypothetical protein